MYWAALLPIQLPHSASPIDGTSLGTWTLQFAPRVTLCEECVLVEVEASARLFGGIARLRELVEQGAAELGARVAWAPTGLGALALVRCGISDGFQRPWEKVLDKLPLTALTPVAEHQATLARVGCRTLGDVRALPRGGISRRFSKDLLRALDLAYGLRPETYAWLNIPESFHVRLELMSRVESAPALLFGARRLLLQMSGWLQARRLGATAYTFRWCHDVMRAKDAGTGGELVIRTAIPTQNVEHLGKLLAEHLAKVTLLAPAGDIELLATEVFPIVEESRSLLPEACRRGASTALALERMQARFGNECIRRPQICSDHRLEHGQAWSHSNVDKRMKAPSYTEYDLPQPTWLLAEPLRLIERDNRPHYQGPLQLLLGPDRIEGGWWHRVKESDEEVTLNVQRDYYLALSPHAGLLWVFQARLAADQTAWFLHGHFG